MKLFGCIVESSLRSRHKWNHFKIHKGHTRHLVWGKISIQYGPEQFCEECEKSIGLSSPLCDECDENLYCECGQRLEDSYGNPGDGFCIRCR
jgi:predicted amidophosphoribosyltransferase